MASLRRPQGEKSGRVPSSRAGHGSSASRHVPCTGLGPLARIARILGTSFVGIEVLYLVAANGFLALGGVPKLFGGTESVKADVASAWTLLPGIIHARGLTLTIQDHNVQALIQMDRVDVVLSLHELASHVFHATRVRGSGLVFRFRNRVDPGSADRPSVRALPPIRGFEDPPVYAAWVPEPPIPDARYDLWTVRLDNVDVRADELWVEQLRYLGAARAIGAFELEPARHLWVGPASLALEPGRVVAGAENVLSAFSGTIEATVAPFDVREPDGLAVLRYISTKVHLRGDVSGGALVELVLPPGARAHVDPRGTKLLIDAALDRGVLTASSRVSIAGDSLRVRADPLSADLTGPWSVVGTADGSGGGGRVVATVSRALVHRHGFESVPLTIRDATLALTSTSRDTTVAWAVRGGDLTLGELAAPDLRVLNDVRLGAVRFRAGAGSLRGHLAYSPESLAGRGAAEVRAGVVDVAGTEIRGTASIDVTARAFDEHRGTGSFDFGMHGSSISAATITSDAPCERPPWGRLDETEAEGHLLLAARGSASGKLDASIDGAQLRWGDMRVAGNADLRATLVPALEAGEEGSRISGVLRGFQVRLQGGAGPPKRWRAGVPEVIVDASLALRDGKLHGPVELTAKRARAAIGEVSMKTDVQARLLIDPLDVARRSATLSGVVDVTRATLWNGDHRVEGWWAKIGVSPTRVVAAQDLELDGHVSARFRDGLPGLLALSESDSIPGFLPDLLPLQGLVGTIDVQRHCRLTDARFSRVEGGPLVASGRIQNVPGETRGAVLVRLSGLELVSAGVSLGGHGDGMSLFAGDDWLAKRVDGLGRRVAWVAAHECAPPSVSVCD